MPVDDLEGNSWKYREGSGERREGWEETPNRVQMGSYWDPESLLRTHCRVPPLRTRKTEYLCHRHPSITGGRFLRREWGSSPQPANDECMRLR